MDSSTGQRDCLVFIQLLGESTLSRRPLCILCYLALGTLVAAVVGFALSARGQQPDAPKPSPEHEVLKMEEGVWYSVVKIIAPEGAIEGKGTETNRLMKGGLWLVSDYEDSDPNGFFGHGILGYDPAKKKFVGSWVDNMSTGKPMKQKHVTVYKADVREFAIYVTGPDGKDMKVLEMTAKRRKK
ncbi:MAG: DUF1579 family protein [Planctomycetia bacterium]|nr:DUF1579 family protein [Planctomycetia bacterium]